MDFTLVRSALAVAIQNRMYAHQLDIRTAFLHGDIDGTVYVSPPDGLDGIGVTLCSRRQTLRLQKGLYGLKQAPKLWNQKWISVMDKMTFQAFRPDSCMYYRNGV